MCSWKVSHPCFHLLYVAPDGPGAVPGFSSLYTRLSSSGVILLWSFSHASSLKRPLVCMSSSSHSQSVVGLAGTRDSSFCSYIFWFSALLSAGVAGMSPCSSSGQSAPPPRPLGGRMVSSKKSPMLRRNAASSFVRWVLSSSAISIFFRARWARTSVTAAEAARALHASGSISVAT